MKTCNHCKREKPFTEFYKCRALRDGLQKSCKTCTSERKKVQSCTEKSRETRKRWMGKNPDKLKQYSEKWYANNKDIATRWQRGHPEYQQQQTKKDVENLSDKYIKQMLVKGARASTELIEAKRLHIQIIRKLKELRA